MNAKPTALDAYLARTAAIHAKLERLQQLADDCTSASSSAALLLATRWRGW